MFIQRRFPKDDGDFEILEEYTTKTFDALGRIVLYKNIKYQWFFYDRKPPHDYILTYSRIGSEIEDKYPIEEIVFSDAVYDKCFCGVDTMGQGKHQDYCPKFSGY